MLSPLHTKHKKFQQNSHFLQSKISPTPKDKRNSALPIHGLSSPICLPFFFFFFGLILSLGWCECWKDGLSILAIIPCSLEWVFLIFCVLSLVYGFRFFGHCFDWIQGNCWLFPCQHMNSKIVWLLVLWFSLSWSLPWGFCENVEIHVLKPGSLSFIKNVFVFVALACCGVNIYSLLFLALWMRIFSRLLF